MKSVSYLITVTTVLIMLTACSQSEEAPQQELVKSVNVETRTVTPQPFERYLRLVGTVETDNDVRISAEIAGRVIGYRVDKGDRVAKGQTIAKIDDSQLLREKERLEALTAQSRENYQRLKRLFEEDSVGSEIEYLNAKYTYEQNKASLESVKVQLDKTNVVAPFNATVEDKMVDEGEMVSPGMGMVRLIGDERLKINVGVPARFSDVVSRGDMAQVWFDFSDRDTLRLPLTFVGKSIDPQARTFEAEIALPSEHQRYKVDMVANAKIRTQLQDSALVVGQEFIYQKENYNVVYVVGQNEQGETVALERRVELGPAYENNVVIRRGLESGERLITTGSSFVQNNMRITIVEESTDEFAQTNTGS